MCVGGGKGPTGRRGVHVRVEQPVSRRLSLPPSEKHACCCITATVTPTVAMDITVTVADTATVTMDIPMHVTTGIACNIVINSYF